MSTLLRLRLPLRLHQHTKTKSAILASNRYCYYYYHHHHHFQSSPYSTTRTAFQMANLTPGKYEYLVTIPDHADVLQKRLAARSEHLANLMPSVKSGKVVMGGALLSEQHSDAAVQAGEPPKMVGSVMLVKADSEEEVRQILAVDPYTHAGVWDVAKAEIRAFKTAVRLAS